MGAARVGLFCHLAVCGRNLWATMQAVLCRAQS